MARVILVAIAPLALMLTGCGDRAANTAATADNASRDVAQPAANDVTDMNDTMTDATADNMMMGSDGMGDAGMTSAQKPDGKINYNDM